MIRQLIYPRARLGGRHWDMFALSLDPEGADVRRSSCSSLCSISCFCAEIFPPRAVKGNTLGSRPIWACVITITKFLKQNSHSVSVPFVLLFSLI